ncbi:MAG: murein biosynthesis integral membrane protein MurJ, partial [Steroidobacteraceae bacterium]|nr:murein biosynthesis integral membrane protein MurJ [Steroidobacteraceae bacterium]MDW8260520.1 lipid II flippase MurJ [Gammaproteobacteria bacterium]
FARQDTRFPVRAGLIALGVGMALNLLIVLPAHFAGFPVPHVLLATSTSVSAAVNSLLLWRGLKRAGIWQSGGGWTRLLLQVAFASIAMAAFLVWQAAPLDGWIESSALERIGRMSLCVLGGAGLYFAVLWATGMRLRHWLGGARAG